MTKPVKKSKPKKRENKYQEKVRINGTFDDLMGALFPVSSPKTDKKGFPKEKKEKAVRKKK